MKMATKRFRNHGIIFLSLILLFSCNFEFPLPVNSDSVLWYTEPAAIWEDALPLGNGQLGAMVFGDPETEHLQLNDDSMWPGDDDWDNPDAGPKELQHLREVLIGGDQEKADALFVEKFSRKKIIRSHQTMGDLFLDWQHKDISEYRRELNLDKATARVEYKTAGHLVSEDIYISHPHRCLVMEVISEAPEGLNGKIRMSRPLDEGVVTHKIMTADHQMAMLGEVSQRGGIFNSDSAPILHGAKFETLLSIHNEGGKVISGSDHLELEGVQRAIFVLVSTSSYYHEDYIQENRRILEKIQSTNLHEIKKQHIADFSSLFDRTKLELEGEVSDTLSTAQRLQQMKDGGVDLGMEQLLFDYGRYLLISSSRVGTYPANLQGLWNKHIQAPWNADYHLNINLQMNYWPANLCGLDELNLPLFEYLDKLIENGKETAQKNFGCRGSYLPHATDFWAPTWIRAARAYWGCSMGAGGWMVQHYWTHYQFTQDKHFLKNRAYPAIREVAQFYSDWLIEDPRDGTLISVPSTSPENRYFNSDGKQVATCLGSAMDQQVISEVFHNFLSAAELLGEEDELTQVIKDQLSILRPGFVLGSDGRILEWDREYKEPEPGHRHMSHLYGFHPGSAISKEHTPELFEAVRTTLDYRLANGGAGTGWSRAWLINCSARLLDGEMAHEHIRELFRKSIHTNLFDLHPPFQIDGNFGYTSAVAEILLQSHEEGFLRLLPALPEAWANGSVKGLKARGGITVDMTWEDNILVKAVLNAGPAVELKMVYQNQEIDLKLKENEEFVFKPSE